MMDPISCYSARIQWQLLPLVLISKIAEKIYALYLKRQLLENNMKLESPITLDCSMMAIWQGNFPNVAWLQCRRDFRKHFNIVRILSTQITKAIV